MLGLTTIYVKRVFKDIFFKFDIGVAEFISFLCFLILWLDVCVLSFCAFITHGASEASGVRNFWHLSAKI